MTPSDKYLAKSSDIAARVLGDETIIMSSIDSTLFSLNATATVIWQAADGKTPLARIIKNVCEEFDVAPERAWKDAEELIEKLVEHGILLVSDHPIQQ